MFVTQLGGGGGFWGHNILSSLLFVEEKNQWFLKNKSTHLLEAMENVQQ